MIRRPPRSTLFPTRRSSDLCAPGRAGTPTPTTCPARSRRRSHRRPDCASGAARSSSPRRSEEHTSELQSPDHLVCRLLLEKKKRKQYREKNTERKNTK